MRYKNLLYTLYQPVRLTCDAFELAGLSRCWLGVLALSVLVRLAFLGWLDLLPEEAYYWNYAQHVDIGYLDHPPMTAWLNWIFGNLLGRSEFVVRLPAFLGWFLFGWFMFRLTRNLFDTATAVWLVLLLALLPIFMSVGFLMTPDAPFYAAWAGCLFFLERALLGTKSKAWLGVGICLGLGLLSKYTMGLLIPAVALFVILDRDSRKWLTRPEPYLALTIGLLLFMPTIYWNYTHDWVSFTFQSTRRWSEGISFHLHTLIGSALILLTPLGVIEAGRSLTRCWKQSRTSDVRISATIARGYRFMLVFTVVPLAVFVIHSLQGLPQLNWTGPAWLAILPMMASELRRLSSSVYKQWWKKLYISLLKFTGPALLAFYTAGFGYIVAGMPGAPITTGMPVPVAWEEFAVRVDQIEARLEAEIQPEPIVVGLDIYWIASEVNFYDRDVEVGDTLPEMAAEGLFGRNSLMWNRWAPAEAVSGRDALLLSFSEGKLTNTQVTSHFEKLGDVSRESLRKRDREVACFYWRVGYNYRP
jgi:dolichol-phosphate mannosyltransferase